MNKLTLTLFASLTTLTLTLSPLSAKDSPMTVIQLLEAARTENQQAAAKTKELYQVLDQGPDFFQTMDVLLQALIYTASRLYPVQTIDQKDS